jgi:hypothetical protein
MITSAYKSSRSLLEIGPLNSYTSNNQLRIKIIMGSSSKVTLFPWDPNSDIHLKCLVSQRVECGWDKGKVETKWKKQQLKGEKCIYWVVSSIQYYSPLVFKTKQECLQFAEKVLPSDGSQAISPKVRQQCKQNKIANS